MECKKCRSVIDDQSTFCPYCGEKVEKNEKETYVDPFEAYRQVPSHQMQYQYQQSYSNRSVESNGSKKNSNTYSIVGIFLSLASIFCCFIHIALGIVLLVISLVLIISGFHCAKKRTRIASVIFAILSTLLVIFVSLMLWLFSLPILLENGMQYTIKEYLMSAFFNGLYSHNVYGVWMSEASEILDLTSEEIYLFYAQGNQLPISGTYSLGEGHSIGSEDSIYSDRDFYFFDFVDESENFSHGKKIILCLDKKDFSRLVLYFPKENIHVDLKRVEENPYFDSRIEDISANIGSFFYFNF